MECGFSDGSGWCTTRFKGFACVGDKCELHPEFSQDANQCPDEGGDGVYCHRFHRFFCAGRDHCSEHEAYIRRMRVRWKSD